MLPRAGNLVTLVVDYLEELKMQLGDALPGAVQVFAKALGLTEAQLFKQMEMGKVLSADALPKVAKAYREAAEAGGAYAMALQGLRVTEGRMQTEAQRAGNKIFKSGFSEGLANLYETISKLLETSGPQLKRLGEIFGKVFNGIAYMIERLAPFLKIIIDHFEVLFGAVMIRSILKMGVAIRSFGIVAAASLGLALAPITALLLGLAAIEEFFANFDPDKISAIELAQGYQVIDGRRVGIEKRDGQYFKGSDMGEASSGEKFTHGIYDTMSGGISGILDTFDKDSIANLEEEKARALRWEAMKMSVGFGGSAEDSSIFTVHSSVIQERISEVKLTLDVTGVPNEVIADKISQELTSFIQSGSIPHTR